MSEFWVVCSTCAVAPERYDPDEPASSHEVLTRDRVYATLVYGEHARRGHTVRSLEVSG